MPVRPKSLQQQQQQETPTKVALLRNAAGIRRGSAVETRAKARKKRPTTASCQRTVSQNLASPRRLILAALLVSRGKEGTPFVSICVTSGRSSNGWVHVLSSKAGRQAGTCTISASWCMRRCRRVRNPLPPAWWSAASSNTGRANERASERAAELSLFCLKEKEGHLYEVVLCTNVHNQRRSHA